MEAIEITKESFFLSRYFMRFYIWLWNPNLATLTNCRIAWGLAFSPLAFLSIAKKEMRFIPRLSILIAIIGSILFLLGHSGAALSAVVIAVLLAIEILFLDHFFKKKIDTAIEKQKTRQAQIEAMKYGKFEKAFDWIDDTPIGGWIIDSIYKTIDVISVFKNKNCRFVRVSF